MRYLFFLAMLVAASVVPVNASEGWIVYQEPDFSDRSERLQKMFGSLMERDSFVPTKEQLEAWKQSGYDMERQGFTVVPESALGFALLEASEQGTVLRTQLRSLEEVSQVLAYERMDLVEASLIANLEGVFVGQADRQGRVHEIAYIFGFPSLGRVSLQESSFATDKERRVARAAPLGNITINGTPGSLLVMKSEDGSKGKSFVDVVLNGRIMTLTILDALEGDELEAFKQIAYRIR